VTVARRYITEADVLVVTLLQQYLCSNVMCDASSAFDGIEKAYHQKYFRGKTK